MTEGAWNNLGLYERDVVKDRGAARQAFEKSLALRPDYHSPMFNLAVLERDAEAFRTRRKTGSSARSQAGHADPEGTIQKLGACLSGRPATTRPSGACSSGALASTPRASAIARDLVDRSFPGEGLPGSGRRARVRRADDAGPRHTECARPRPHLSRPQGGGDRVLRALARASPRTSPASSSP